MHTWKYIVAVIIFTIFATLTYNQAMCEDFSRFTNDEIVEAIGKAENSVKYPYGIKSINTNGNKEYARKICLNSVKNGRARWEKAGKPDDLIIFIGRRYCPIGAPDDPRNLNSNWVRNVKRILSKK